MENIETAVGEIFCDQHIQTEEVEVQYCMDTSISPSEYLLNTLKQGCFSTIVLPVVSSNNRQQKHQFIDI